MSDDDPRWRDDPELDGAMRELLDAGAAEVPHEEQLERLEARLFPTIPPEGGGSSGGAPPAGPWMKIALTLAGIGATAGAVWLVTQPSAQPRTEPLDARVPSAIDASVEPLEIGDAAFAPLDAAIEALPIDAGRTARARRPADPASELPLVQAAQAALSTSPSRALSLTNAHLRDFPEGPLAQEREVIAIDALVRLQRVPAARTRAARFHERWPTSAHRRRIDVLVAEP